MVEQLISVVIIAIVIQTVVENLKKLIKFPSGYYKKILNLKVLLTMIVSLIICVSSQIELLSLLGVELVVPYLDSVITGIVCSSGATTIHEIVKKINESRNGAN